MTIAENNSAAKTATTSHKMPYMVGACPDCSKPAGITLLEDPLENLAIQDHNEVTSLEPLAEGGVASAPEKKEDDPYAEIRGIGMAAILDYYMTEKGPNVLKEAALKMIEKAPKHPIGYVLEAIAIEKIDDAEALKALSKARQLDPTSPVVPSDAEWADAYASPVLKEVVEGTMWIVQTTYNFSEFPKLRFSCSQNLIILRLSSGNLALFNTVGGVPESVWNQIKALGVPKYLLIAAVCHGRYISEMLDRFPDLKVYGVPMHLGKPRFDNHTFTGMLTDPLPEELAKDLEGIPYKGNAIMEDVFLYHPATKTMVLNDVFFFKTEKDPWFLRVYEFILAQTRFSEPNGIIQLSYHQVLTVDKTATQSAIEKVVSRPTRRFVGIHGEVWEGTEEAAVKEVRSACVW
eukprot:CAMPEP_0184673526 /NCGR_PEP_ID=MMETSP0308-20130426/86730_1 /TAXON_ID=38269 /ORGANISM="Gloeochaete witrockiana, Strain SAG 46.84" /LENGTH=403 /DNA_ID=CAMNT_0027121023 /DNA_START=708 /DNA_END=1916 /DNA_ORIENTATION=-